MELMAGYKQTEVGVIPDDWDVSSFDDLATLKSGVGITSDSIDEHSDFPCYGGNGIRGYAKQFTHSGSHALIGRQGALCGNVVLARDKFFASEHAVVVTARSRTDIEWLAIVLAVMNLGQYSESSAQPGLSVGKLKKLLISHPKSFDEQRAIADALSDADALIASLDALIAKKRDLKQAAMQQLLTGKTRLPGFTGDWEVKRLGEIGKFLKGSGVRRDEAQSGNLPCVRYGEIYTTHHNVIRKFSSHISRSVAEMATRIQFRDLLFAGSGETKEEIGKCVALAEDVEAYAGGDIVILRASTGSPVFLGYLMNSPSVVRQKANLGQGDAVVHISAAALASIEIVLPDEPEQQAVAAVLTDMATELASLESQRDKARALKQGMMQELLTGRIRLV